MNNKKGDIAIENIIIIILVLVTALLVASLLLGFWGPGGKLPALFNKILNPPIPW